MNWLKQAFEGLGDITDIFNLGRLVFYTAAGALLCYPAAGAVVVLTGHAMTGAALADLVIAMRGLAGAPLAVASVVTGFVLAAYGWVRVVDRATRAVKIRAEAKPIDRRSYPYRFPQLKATAVDYDAWLIKEYFRFVEIVTYVPMGLIAGLAATLTYAAVYVVLSAASTGSTALTAAHRDLVVTACAFAVVAFVVWPRFWIPSIVTPVLEAYFRAKVLVVAWLDEHSAAPAGKDTRNAGK
jgi:hypothetical protein